MTALAEFPLADPHGADAPALGAGPRQVARTALRDLARRRRLRSVSLALTLVGVLVALSAAALTLGDYRLSVAQVLAALTGDDAPPAGFIVGELRLPRLQLGLLVGLSFGLAGALFQSVLRNPLASPDIIGVSQGASAGAVGALLVAGVTGWWVTLAALAGGLAVGLALYAVAWRGGMTGHRFVLAGIGVAYLCTSVVGYLLTRSELQAARDALVWMTGSLGQATPQLVDSLALALCVLVPLVALVARGLRLLLLGDEQATALGARPERVRAAVVLLGVALACVATAAAGPVAFVALVAAPIARRLAGHGSVALLPAALVGAVLVVGADLVAQHLAPADLSLPVGVVTGVVGGPYLIWLMVTGRARTA